MSVKQFKCVHSKCVRQVMRDEMRSTKALYTILEIDLIELTGFFNLQCNTVHSEAMRSSHCERHFEDEDSSQASVRSFFTANKIFKATRFCFSKRFIPLKSTDLTSQYNKSGDLKFRERLNFDLNRFQLMSKTKKLNMIEISRANRSSLLQSYLYKKKDLKQNVFAAILRPFSGAIKLQGVLEVT